MSTSVVDSPSVEEVVPPLGPRQQIVRAVLLTVFACAFGLCLQLVVVSRLQHHAAQGRLFAQFRGQLANGIAAIGPTDDANRMLAMGTPVALLEIPRLGLREVVGEGTTSSVLFSGPGHRRDTPLPGQEGTSIVYGRRAAYGGPFGDIGSLRKGDALTVTTGQGSFTFSVIDVRRAGDPLPAPLAAGRSRVTLVTAAGSAFMPNGLLRVDADLTGQATGGPARVITTASLPPEETALHGDSRTLWALVLWLQALLVVAVGAVWAWHRWGRAQTWIVFVPLVFLVGLEVAGQVARLLPNLL